MPQSRIFQNFLGARRQAEADQRAQQERDLQKQAAAGGVQSQAFQDFAGVNPVAASKLGGILGDIGEDRERSLFQDARKLNNALKADDIPGSLSLIKNRLDMGDKLALESNQPWDPSDTLEMKEKIEAGLISEVIADLDLVEQAGIQSGLIKSPQGQEKRTATSKDFDRFQGFIAKAKESGLPEDEAKATQFGRRAGFIRETEQESADIKVNAAERKEVAKFNVKRKQGFIESGIDAADSTANIRRSLDLLKNVETGGFDNIALKLKSAFGVEGANELELSNNLGKSVLQQLKPLFGSAFTVQEGNKLERISAKFGSSTEANVRLLNQMLRISERGARRGLAAAEDQGDVFTADEIRKSLAFKLDDKDVSSDTPPQQSNTPPPSTSGFKILSIE